MLLLFLFGMLQKSAVFLLGTQTSTLFEEPMSDDLPEMRPPSATVRPSSVAGILKKKTRSSKYKSLLKIITDNVL